MSANSEYGVTRLEIMSENLAMTTPNRLLK